MHKEEYEIELLQNVNDDLEKEILSNTKTVEFQKGNLPFFNDDLLDYFYIVIDGRIKAYQINLDTSKEQTLFIYRQGDMLDTMILLDSKPHELLYEALDKTKVMQIPLHVVRNWMYNNTEFKKKFFPYLASQLRHYEELSSDLSLLDTSHRFVKLLLQNEDTTNRFKYKLLKNLSNSEIAKLLGTVRHVVERHIKELKDKNLITKSRSNISIKKIENLLQKTKQMLLK